jgi:hypothetical protein
VTPPSGTVQTSSSKALATAISQFDLSNADYGTFLLKDRINDEGYAYSLVTLKQDALQTLYQHIANVKDITQQIETSDPADTIAHAALVEELATRENQLSASAGRGRKHPLSPVAIGACGGVFNAVIVYDFASAKCQPRNRAN